ncbi:transposase [Haloechinothrix sp. YIM 98757]|uniref:Transposase n=1 Tax=Haloechinothrix aidingensis TaxID=2752311 RepID=A0A838A8U6_9PSEU|nr:RNA-guided endonuclease TnpB family protein [Haloechinothrix aidingensis]MBA0124971.1 transposase [Haloechinothrix aidingensis]
MTRHTTFRYCLDPTVDQRAVLARHAGAARFAFNQCLRLHLQARKQRRDESVMVPWTGFDLINGLNALVVAATSDGREVARVSAPPKALAAGMNKQRRLARAVTRKQKGSKNRRKAAARLGRHHARVRNIRQHFLHQVTGELVKTHDRLVLEDLNVSGMLANPRLARSISDAGWTELARLLAYKQAWRQGDVVVADRWFASSKSCSGCGTVRASMGLDERTYHCETCTLILDRDLNAAINLAIWAEKDHAQVRDHQAGGPVTNAHRQERSGRHPGDGETSLDDVGTDAQPAPAA